MIVSFITPAYPAVSAHTANTREALIGRWRHWAPADWFLRHEVVKQQPVTAARHILATNALIDLRTAEHSGPEWGPSDVLLWLDADVALDAPRDLVRLVELLAAAPEDVALVGAPTPIRCETFEEGRATLPLNVSMYGMSGGATAAREAHERGDPMFEIAGIGFGCVATRASVYRSMPQPWFQFKHGPDGQLSGTEDMLWCDAARLLGYRIMATPLVKTRHFYEVGNSTDTDTASLLHRQQKGPTS